MTKKYHANGKFLLTGEYAVLDGVRALAIPLKLKQYLSVTPTDSGKLHWQSRDYQNKPWLDLEFSIDRLDDLNPADIDQEAKKLLEIMRKAKALNPNFKWERGYEVATSLDFKREWGMGTSSTIISMVADWIGCDPYKLQFECFSGSGFDIACARAQGPIIYQKKSEEILADPVVFKPLIKSQLFFVYLNRKQNSRSSIASFQPGELSEDVRKKLDSMPERFIDACNDVVNLNKVIHEHEYLISDLVKTQHVKSEKFSDYPGAIKSLGGWGGDFILATGGPEDRKYFKDRGHETIFEWDDVVL